VGDCSADQSLLSSVLDWHTHLLARTSQVVGVILIKPSHSPSVSTLLNKEEREMRRYYSESKYADCALFYFSILDSAELETYHRCQTGVRDNSHTTFFDLEEYTVDWLLEQATKANGSVLGNIIEHWEALYNQGKPFACPRLAAAMPAAHALLRVRRCWLSFSFPALRGRQAGSTGLH